MLKTSRLMALIRALGIVVVMSIAFLPQPGYAGDGPPNECEDYVMDECISAASCAELQGNKCGSQGGVGCSDLGEVGCGTIISNPPPGCQHTNVMVCFFDPDGGGGGLPN